ncbi:plasmid pRiA4b ORF-3 family protein [Candidatus Scalindua japonica]|uniref:Plasmid pRiA4b ORF-3 family protein n=1 Tax=Candidatus Scalindua japonica TaxID=1284222 RepID=A0A286U3C6_9BACT|nr:hypothetical protein [Candidatus Scalindua japonica]GAX62633.1 plasmid pRiA4b ORF-3 family protein [Candidatus Scalindua japonica]
MREIYTLTVELESGMNAKSTWKRVIELSEETDLYDLHLYIQKIIGFDNDHLFEFFVGKSWRKRERVFGNEDENGFEERKGLDTMLNEVYPLTGLKLYYHFDFGDSWMFKIKKGRKKKYLVKGITYPRVIESEGENPDQYPSWEDE